MPKSLYICYFGVGEPLVQTQVLPYLREIKKDGIGISLLTFEPTHDTEKLKYFSEIKAQFDAEGIEWEWLPYHKRPSAVATAWDILRGTIRVSRMHRRAAFDIFHCRIHVPGVMGALARTFSRKKPKMLFDIRGFFPEEYTDAGVWPERGWLYRIAKRVEKWLMKESDGFVVLTEKAREILFPESVGSGFDKDGRPVEVIPCCIDKARFENVTGASRAAIRKRLGIEERYVIVYVGSFGGWYLSEEMLDFFMAAKEADPRAFFMILTQRDVDKVKGRLLARGVKERDLFVDSVKPEEIPVYLAAGDASVSFIKACYSKQAASPTKIPEYLACGLSIIANRGVGDVDSLITDNNVGALLTEFSPAAYVEAIAKVELLGEIGDRCRATAYREFDLETVAGVRYRRIYQRLLSV